MAIRVQSAGLLGVDAVLVDVEAQIISALKRFVIVGLPDGVLREAKDRVRCAIENSGLAFPSGEVIVNLAPASLPKQGAGFDFAIALSILAASGQVNIAELTKFIVLGELALDGEVKPTVGVLAAALAAKVRGGIGIMTAPASATLAAHVEHVPVLATHSLLEAVCILNGTRERQYLAYQAKPCSTFSSEPGFGDVVGQHAAKRAIEIAAAGGHNLLMVGPPGSGKSMLARRIVSVLPAMSEEEALEVSKIYAAGAGKDVNDPRLRLAEQGILITQRPFRSPHHTTTGAGLLGGGPIPQPGEISLAHRGVLFLDEFAEMRRDILESLREPLENRCIEITRARSRVRFPADFMLVAAMNPCPCGKRGQLTNKSGLGNEGSCECAPTSVRRYLHRVSGPILDRIDLQVWVPPVPLSELGGSMATDPTETMRNRIKRAREQQGARAFRAGSCNASLSPIEVKKFCRIPKEGLTLLESAAKRFNLSARGYTRILKVSRTIADLEESKDIEVSHLSEALSYRLPI